MQLSNKTTIHGITMTLINKTISSLIVSILIPIGVNSTEPEQNDVLALTPWELLGEDDGLGDMFSSVSSFQSDLVDFAKLHLGRRYRRGGKGPHAFDCSGFTSYVFRNFNISLSPASRLQGNEGNTVGHVGMVIEVDNETGTVKFIHASSTQGVVIQTFPDGGYYSKHYLHSTRVIDESNYSQKKAHTKF